MHSLSIFIMLKMTVMALFFRITLCSHLTYFIAFFVPWFPEKTHNIVVSNGNPSAFELFQRELVRNFHLNLNEFLFIFLGISLWNFLPQIADGRIRKPLVSFLMVCLFKQWLIYWPFEHYYTFMEISQNTEFSFSNSRLKMHVNNS